MDAVVAVDERGTIVLFNETAERLTGFRGADVIGRPVRETLIPPSERSAFDGRFAHLLDDGRALDAEPVSYTHLTLPTKA